VTAVELDRSLAAYLHEHLAEPIEAGRLRLIEGDALDLDLPDLVPPPYRVVANIPYHITSPILHRLLERPPRPERLVLMLQAEVADRIAAPPGRMSYLSVFVQFHATVRVALRVPPEAFEPAPKVASAVVVLEPHAERLLPPEREERSGAGPVRLPRAPQDAPQRAGAAAPGRRGRATGRRSARRASTRRSRRPASTATAARRRCPSTTGRLLAASDERRRELAGAAPVVRLAPAKLNLTLAVVGRRPDGFHDLHSVMVPLGLADRLSLARGGGPRGQPARGRRCRRRDALDPRLRTPSCRRSPRRASGGPGADTFPLAVRLEKRIPVAAGLAGGSSDAAAAIDGALEAWGASSSQGDRSRPRRPWFGRAVLPRRRTGAGRGPRRARHAARRVTGDPPACCS
jgi:hypothetical protein